MKSWIWKDEQMVRRLSLTALWFLVALLVLTLNLSYLSALKKGKEKNFSYKTPVFEIVPANEGKNESSGKVLGTSVESGDARKMIVKNFVSRYQSNSPFLTHADLIVDLADKYNIDFRLVPAIAMCESNLGVRVPSKDSYNAWGIAVYTGQLNGKKFNDWPHAFEWVSKYIRERFYDKGITDLRDIGAIWAPPSVEKEYSWTRCVESFLEHMQ